jgi:phosphoglycolate phosphatase
MDLRDTTIVFDIDGTLVDTAPDLILAINHSLEHFGYASAPPSVLHGAMSHGARRMLEAGLGGQGVTASDDVLEAMTAKLLAYYGVNIAVDSKAYPGVIETLEALAKRGANLAVCTNKMEGLSRKLISSLALYPNFSAICGRDTFAVSKPHPGHLIQTVEAAGGDVRRAVMVGDSEVDIMTAKAADIPVVAVSYGYTETLLASLAPDALIDDFADLPAAIDAVLAARV